MRTPPICLASLALAACTHPPSNAPAPAIRYGVYSFTEHPDGVKDAIQGRVLIKEDTLVVEMDSKPPCRTNPYRDVARGFVYDCGDVTVAFSRLDPVVTASYTTTKTVVDRQKTCIRYTKDASGNQVCSQQSTESVDRRVPVNGRLHLAYVVNP